MIRSPVASAAAAKSAKAIDLGILPVWNLQHLYPSMDSAAYADDLAKVAIACKAFSQDYRGKIAGIATGAQAAKVLTQIIQRYEALDDLLGRIMSYAGLMYSGDTTNPARAKFYGDAQEKITAASADLLFFQLELNRLDDGVLEKIIATAPLAHFRPWLEDIAKEKPFQLDDRLEQLFLEKSVTARAAWNRLFDDTIAALRFKVKARELTLEPVLNLMQDPSEAVRKEA